jgi:hypothetical protein
MSVLNDAKDFNQVKGAFQDPNTKVIHVLNNKKVTSVSRNLIYDGIGLNLALTENDECHQYIPCYS